MISNGYVVKVTDEYLVEYNKFLKNEEPNLEFRKITIPDKDLYILTIKGTPEKFLQNKVQENKDGKNAQTFISEDKEILENILNKNIKILKSFNDDDDEVFKLIVSLSRKRRESRNNNNNNPPDWATRRNNKVKLNGMTIENIKIDNFQNKKMIDAINFLEFTDEEKFDEKNLKKKFNKLSLLYHPDKRNNGNQELFKTLNSYNAFLRGFL